MNLQKKKEGAFEKNASFDLFSLPLFVLSHERALFEEGQRRRKRKRREEEEKREFEEK
tara:strand:+ start:290 stop:463 length:174 start_codon:yes stop_codon:yes gene_type:complete